MTAWTCLECGAVNPTSNLICGSRSCQQQRLEAASSNAAAAPLAVAASAEAASSNGRSNSSDQQQQPFAQEGSKALEPKPLSTRKNRYTYTDPHFLEFWELYPLKRGKAAAARRFAAAVAAGVEPQQIIKAAAAYRDDPNRNPDFTKWPEGWLTAGRWEDEYEVVRPESHEIRETDWEAMRAEDDARVAAILAEDSA